MRLLQSTVEKLLYVLIFLIVILNISALAVVLKNQAQGNERRDLIVCILSAVAIDQHVNQADIDKCNKE